jgi:peptide/nickel transport system permease protein
MMGYFLRRLLYALPLLLGINILTFVLFFVVNTPDDMARMHLGQKHVTPESMAKWKHERGYDLPLFYAAQETGFRQLTQTIFVQKSLGLMVFEFGQSDAGRNIAADIRERMWPSLAIAVPSLVLGLVIDISLALLLVFFRMTRLEYGGLALCVALMSISTLFYIIAGQYLFGRWLQWVPISGFGDGLEGFRFVILPVLIGSIAGVGSGVRWYRTLFIEEIEKDYVRTARAKGLSEVTVLFRHVLRNALIPILTGVVVLLPLLFTGSLLTESFFAIPGLGSYTIDAINQQDFAIVRAMVFLGAALYILGLVLTDLSYVLVDPRIRLEH